MWDIPHETRAWAAPGETLTHLPVFSSALLPCSSSKVEKNEDGDQKIEQDGIKPEDKAHKAATKIQASFRGHITRKKLKGEKKGDAPASETDAADKKEEGPAGGAAENKETEAPTATEAATADSAQVEEGSKDSSAPAEKKKGDGAADTGSEQPAPQAAAPAASSEEKPAAAAAETESATKASTDNSPSLKADEAQDKEEPKQADVPAADTTATTTTPAAEDATAKATAQPQMETVESSQTEEKTGEWMSRLGNGDLHKWIPPLVPWGCLWGWVNKGIPLLGFRGGGSCTFLTRSSLLSSIFWNHCSSSQGFCSSRWRSYPAPLAMVARECQGGLEEPGSVPQALHMLKRLMNLPSHTSTDSCSGAIKQAKLIPAHWGLPTWAEYLTRQFSYCKRLFSFAGVMVKKGLFPIFLWMDEIPGKPHLSQEHIVISIADSIHTNTSSLCTWSSPLQP